MKFIETELTGMFLIEPQIFGDERGYFFESYNEKEFQKHIGDVRFIQDNESKSKYGVIRGLHFQKPPYDQAKLLRVVKGAVLDVCVDLRIGSPTYGKHYSVELTAENHLQLFVPRGFAHGFSVLTEEVVFQYKCDNFYAPQAEGSIMWNDKDLNIDWQIPTDCAIISKKDQENSSFRALESPFVY